MNLNFWLSFAVTFVISFGITFISIPFLIEKMKEKGLVSSDMNKKAKPLLPKIGGIAIFLGFIVASLISMQLYSANINATMFFAAIISISLITLLGLLDDLLDIPDIYRVILPAFAALPLMVVKAGNSVMELPYIGNVNFDLGAYVLPVVGRIDVNLYVLLLIPIGVVACANLINLLAGFNGLEVGGSSVILIVLLAITSFMHFKGAENADSVFLALSMLGASLAFLFFNIPPARIFPGNIATYMYGAGIVAIVILANIERAGAICLVPQIIEFFLKARSKFQAENFGTLKGNRLHYEGKVYSLTHLLMKYLKPTERELVLYLVLLQVVFGIIALVTAI